MAVRGRVVLPCVEDGVPGVVCPGGGTPAPVLMVGVGGEPGVLVGQGVRVAPLIAGSGNEISLVAVVSNAERVAVKTPGGVSGKMGVCA